MDEKPAIRAVLFDFGGVVAAEGFEAGLKIIGARAGLEPETFFRQGTEAVYGSGYVTGRGSEADFWNLLRQRTGVTYDDRAMRDEILDRFIPRPAMLTAVSRLRDRGLVVAMLSDQTDWLDLLNERHHFFPAFDSIFNSYHLGLTKRDPAIFDRVTRALDLPPAACLFVDDNPGHIERAQSRGLKTLLFKNEEQCLAELGALQLL